MALSAQFSATFTSTSPSCHALGGGVIAIGDDDVLKCWDIENLDCGSPPLVLSLMETLPMLALTMADRDTTLLAATTKQFLSVWVLHRECGCSPTVQNEGSPSIVDFHADTEFKDSLAGGRVHAMTWSNTGAHILALISGRTVSLLDISCRDSRRAGRAIITPLARVSEPHCASPSCCTIGKLFLTRMSSFDHEREGEPIDLLITASENRCFMLHKFPRSRAQEADATLLLRSSLPQSRASLLCVALHPMQAQAVIGDASGTIYVYEFHRHPSSSQLELALETYCTHQIDLSSMAARMNHAAATCSSSESTDFAVLGHALFALAFVPLPLHSSNEALLQEFSATAASLEYGAISHGCGLSHAACMFDRSWHQLT